MLKAGSVMLWVFILEDSTARDSTRMVTPSQKCIRYGFAMPCKQGEALCGIMRFERILYLLTTTNR